MRTPAKEGKKGCEIVEFLRHELAKHVPGCAECTALVNRYVCGKGGRVKSPAKTAAARRAIDIRWDRYAEAHGGVRIME